TLTLAFPSAACSGLWLTGSMSNAAAANAETTNRLFMGIVNMAFSLVKIYPCQMRRDTVRLGRAKVKQEKATALTSLHTFIGPAYGTKKRFGNLCCSASSARGVSG